MRVTNVMIYTSMQRPMTELCLSYIPYNIKASSTMQSVCCVPTLCHIGEPIDLHNKNVVKIICNNENCLEGEYMHKICFDHWECSVLTFLRSTGRARSWSEKQRMQNLWTKKGYDLAYKACGCKCGKGHLRKDLDWIPLQAIDDAKKKRHRKKKSGKPSLVGNVPSSKSELTIISSANRIRSSSISSMSSTSGSPPNTSDCPLSPSCSEQGYTFSRRQDFSSFNSLPRNKINSYHIKIEDEGNDEIRCFILSTLSANKTSGVNCIFCYSHMIIFDRYPLIDGTFFLSPRQYAISSIPVKTDCEVHYLNAICMGCLEGWKTSLHCKYCERRWNGSDLILGTMYSYDVIAAIPCCKERLRCKNCQELIILPDCRLQYFSEYSRSIACSSCKVNAYHFIKPLSTFYLNHSH